MNVLALKQRNKMNHPKRTPFGSREMTKTALSVNAMQDLQSIQAKCACGGGCPQCQSSIPIQAKLKIGSPNDKYEQEADRVADHVMRMPDPAIQRKPG